MKNRRTQSGPMNDALVRQYVRFGMKQLLRPLMPDSLAPFQTGQCQLRIDLRH